MNVTSTDIGRRVLVIDDEKMIADTLALILRSEGYATEVAYDGSSGLASCNDFRPHLVISDVVMPGISGIEVAIELRQKFPNCTILLYSGQAATAQMMEDARSRGHDFELLAKPVHPARLLEKVRAMIGNA
ncbi:MAG TPA: response regulator [Terracidiphilus sp.]|nr:response regulator [Terracidiphilus sp.]